MRGDLSLDFAVGSALFIFAFVSAFSYINHEYSSSRDHESGEISKLKIAQIMEGLPWQAIEKRIILLEGYSENEFVNLSAYRTDLILDDFGEPVCFDNNLKGFAADVSGSRIFYLYSAPDYQEIEHDLCSLNRTGLRKNINEKISSPIYLKALAQMPQVNSSGRYCEKTPINFFSGSGINVKYLDICV